MELQDVFVTQRRLRNVAQLPELIRVSGASLRVPAIVLGELPDGTVFVIDGHQRCVAAVLAGRASLEHGEYLLCQVEHPRPMFGRLADQAVVSRLLGVPFSGKCPTLLG